MHPPFSQFNPIRNNFYSTPSGIPTLTPPANISSGVGGSMWHPLHVHRGTVSSVWKLKLDSTVRFLNFRPNVSFGPAGGLACEVHWGWGVDFSPTIVGGGPQRF